MVKSTVLIDPPTVLWDTVAGDILLNLQPGNGGSFKPCSLHIPYSLVFLVCRSDHCVLPAGHCMLDKRVNTRQEGIWPS